MSYEFQVVIEFDPSYFERGNNPRLALNVYGQQGWQLAAVAPLDEGRGYAIIMQREVE